MNINKRLALLAAATINVDGGIFTITSNFRGVLFDMHANGIFKQHDTSDRNVYDVEYSSYDAASSHIDFYRSIA